MGSAKRLYLYVVGAVSLLVLAIGASELLAVAFGEVADRLGSSVIAGEATGREQLSLAIALVVVGGPIFAIHWRLVERGHRGSGPDAVADRSSSLRALYLGLVSTVAAGTALFAAIGLLEAGIGALLGVPGGDDRASDDLARLLVAAPLWWIHLRRRNADLRQDRLTDAAAWLSRLVRYGWVFIGVLTLLLGTSQLIDTLASTLIDRPGFGGGEDRWLAPLARALAIIVAGAAIAWLHVADARGAVRDAGVIGEDDRASDLRLTYFGAVLLVALGAAAVTLDDALTELGRQALGVAEETGTRAVLETVVGPILVAVPFALAGWLHWTVLRREASGRGERALAAAERMGLHLAALIGIVFLAVGAARLGGILLELAIGSVRVDDFFRSELVWVLAKVVVGVGFWLPSWTAITLRRRSAGAGERLAVLGRTYLLLVVAGALVVGIPSTVLVVFRGIDALLGGRTADLGSEVAIPIATVVVAAIVTAYHGRLVVADQRLARPATTDAMDRVPAIARPATIALVLRAGSVTELETALASLREHLPDGVSLDEP